jgi:hypothetical protein
MPHYGHAPVLRLLSTTDELSLAVSYRNYPTPRDGVPLDDSVVPTACDGGETVHVVAKKVSKGYISELLTNRLVMGHRS